MKRPRYETSLDLADRALAMIAIMPLAELVWRRVIDLRKHAMHQYYRIVALTLSYLHIGHVDAAEQALSYSDNGANDLLLLTDSYVRTPQLLASAAAISERPGYHDTVVVVVQTKADAEAIRGLVGRARIIAAQQFWLDQASDLANHDAAHEVLKLLRQKAESLGAAEIVQAVSMHVHSQLIASLRMSAALRAARDMGGRVIVAAVDGDIRFYQMCYETLLRGGRRPVVALSQLSFAKRVRFDLVDLRLDAPGALNLARLHLNSFSADDQDVSATSAQTDAPAPSAKQPEEAAIALVTDALPGSIYWTTLRNIAAAAKRDGQPLRVLVSRRSAAHALRRVASDIEVALPSIGKTSGAKFREHYGLLLDVLEQVSQMPRTGLSDNLSQALDYSIARLSLPQTIETLGYRAYRTAEDMRRWLNARTVSCVIVLPHWSNLGWAALAVSASQGLTTCSAPTVTIAGNNASIVEWDGVDVIGCYGTQCQGAFGKLGYAKDRLPLVGNLAIERAMTLNQAAARKALRKRAAIATDSRRLVLFATSGVNRNEDEILSAIITYLAGRNVGLIVRPHPSIGRAHYDAVLKSLPRQAVAVVTRGSVHEAIAAADVVVTDFSTVGAEAVLLKRPLLVVNTTGAAFVANNYAELGVAADARSPEEAGPLLVRLIEEGAFWPDAAAKLKTFVDSYNWGGDAKASRRLLETLRKKNAAPLRVVSPVVV